MTALVSILNRQAVAMAADSAVTIGESKIFNTVNKLFALSKVHPVGIMIYSSADVMGVPVETVIKSFRKQRIDKRCSTLEEYKDEFLGFLTHDPFFSDSLRFEGCQDLCLANLARIRGEIDSLIQSEVVGWVPPSKTRIKQIANDRLAHYRDLIFNADPIPLATSTFCNSLRLRLRDVSRYIRDVYKKRFLLSEASSGIISDICVGLLTREFSSHSQTGFVIAGFGEDEKFPQLRSFEFESSYHGVHKVIPGNGIDESHMGDIGAAVVPFAQSEMVETFVKGRANVLDDYLMHFIEDYFQKKIATFNSGPQTVSKTVETVLVQLKNELQSDFVQQLNSYTQKNHVNPLLSTVANMPKEEMAVMAEALVNLTAIKRHLSPDAETVGGPTDVAIISKGDGFIWKQRKHYFGMDLNPHFKENYFRKEMA